MTADVEEEGNSPSCSEDPDSDPGGEDVVTDPRQTPLTVQWAQRALQGASRLLTVVRPLTWVLGRVVHGSFDSEAHNLGC